MSNIKYIGFFNISNKNRVHSLAATNKMKYIIKTINELGFGVDVVSPSWVIKSNKLKFDKGGVITEGLNRYYFPFSGTGKYKLTRLIFIIYSYMWIHFFLIFNIKKEDTLIVYHSTWYSFPIRFLKKLRRFTLILEVEEIYQDVRRTSKRLINLENKLIQEADRYILSNDYLSKRVKDNHKSIVLYGEYTTHENVRRKHDDGLIHLLYAGIVDDVKKGAFNAIKVCQYLPDNYVLHILGFGEVDKLMEIIEDHNSKHACKVVFDGTKEGIEFIEYCQKCHIGLNTHSKIGEYNLSSFPSKILTYLGLGLLVVTSNIECVINSKLRDLLVLYDSENPSEIAKLIMSIDLSGLDNIKELVKLHNEFKSDLHDLITNGEIEVYS